MIKIKKKSLIESFIEEDQFNMNLYITYLLNQSGKINKLKTNKLPVMQ